MKNIMTYKGYMARIEFDPRDSIFTGKVLGIDDSITFHGTTVKELKTDFEAAINHYIADCAATGRTPLKPASGKLMLRISPETHARALTMAKASGKSLNLWAAEVLSKAAHPADKNLEGMRHKMDKRRVAESDVVGAVKWARKKKRTRV